jgi:hypothetical protein
VCSPLTVRLADSPPYHSTYNPGERGRDLLENHWQGTVRDSPATVLQVTKAMMWNSKHPVVALVTTIYQRGFHLTKDALETVEAQLKRLPALEKW